MKKKAMPMRNNKTKKSMINVKKQIYEKSDERNKKL